MNLVLREYRPGDEERIVECHRRVFGEGTPEGRLRSLEHWRWQFERNPLAASRILVAVDEDEQERVAACYSGVPVRMLDRGAVTLATQATDSMVDPAYRRGLKRPGLFATLGTRWYAKYIRPDGDRLSFGLPNPANWRISNAFFRAEIVRTQTILYREPLAPPLAGRGVTVERLERADARFDELFARLGPDLRYVTFRDAAFVNWRFLEHPTFRYDLLAALEGSRLCGYAVLRSSDFLVPGNTLLVDWLVAGGDIDAARELLRAADAMRVSRGGSVLSIVLPDCNPWWRDLQLEGFVAAPIDYLTVGVSTGAAYAPAQLRRDWFYTLADFDIV